MTIATGRYPHLIVLIIAVTALALMLIPAQDVEAGGNGDYPPPTSGDWIINQAIVVHTPDSL